MADADLAPKPKHIIEIYRIPTPASAIDVSRYSRLRLEALRTNPEAFSSTYERDVHLTQEQWRARVETPGRTTLIAVAPLHRAGQIFTSPSSNVASTRAKAPNHEATGAFKDEEKEGEWIGTLSVLHPSMLREDQGDLPSVPRLSEAVKGGTLERYLLVGMWVTSSERKKGVGKMLIEYAVTLVGDSMVSTGELHTPPLEYGPSGEAVEVRKDRIVFLKVLVANESALGAYLKAGFVEEIRDVDHVWMSRAL